MSVTIARAIVAGCRQAGLTVHESDGCYSRGNGQTSAYMGVSVHHTASAFGRDYPTLYNGRTGLAGPLCNMSGNDDGSLTLMAAHPANHAGASGGWDTAPLPVTGLFNKLMWGLEIVYPGTVPMKPAQYHAAAVMARVVCEVLNRPISHVKTHNGTSITGKWDPGYANGKTISIAQFRQDALNTGKGDDMNAQDYAYFGQRFGDMWGVLEQINGRAGELDAKMDHVHRVLGWRPEDGKDRISDMWEAEHLTRGKVEAVAAELAEVKRLLQVHAP